MLFDCTVAAETSVAYRGRWAPWFCTEQVHRSGIFHQHHSQNPPLLSSVAMVQQQQHDSSESSSLRAADTQQQTTSTHQTTATSSRPRDTAGLHFQAPRPLSGDLWGPGSVSIMPFSNHPLSGPTLPGGNMFTSPLPSSELDHVRTCLSVAQLVCEIRDCWGAQQGSRSTNWSVSNICSRQIRAQLTDICSVCISTSRDISVL